ncbi:glycosyltransferase family 2 protein [Sphingomonas psychrotolerans]|uniref:Glycosyltransferase family 2 protein n=1 Tax=Sphingomonas psychrotolerans TaxID=1327635 RepID=A0ABU3N0X7_9SPHN|nr:glycosyltransferase [Sphingomonas psychrotolerans]MDT8758033.1 glycosyltransferase family 2 protein [Sphingomonas psychrotolerans]
MNWPLILDWAARIGAGTLIAISLVCFLVVSIRNLVSVIQLVLAARVFYSRVRPAARSYELWSRYADLAPPVSVIAPCYNEELAIADSVRALLALEYPDHEVIVVNDGSSDATLATMIAEFDMRPIEREQLAVLQKTRILGVYASARHPNLLLVDKENGRKADAVNAGIGFATAPLVCVIDADSIIEPDGLLRGTEPFMADDGSLMAIGGTIRIANGSTVHGGHVRQVRLPSAWLPRYQILEYLRAFLTARIANARLDMLLLISGAFGIFRRSVLVEIGGYRHDTVGEDLEIVTRIHRHMREQNRPYRVDFVPEVICWTEAPYDWGGLRNQRSRWQQGALETLVRHRRMLFNPRYGRIGMVGMPLLVIEDVLGPPCEIVGYLLVPLLYLLGLTSGEVVVAFFSLTVLFGTAISLGTLVLEEMQLRRTPSARDLFLIAVAALVENFGYRQANLVFRLRGIWRFIRKDVRWASATRAGFAKD